MFKVGDKVVCIKINDYDVDSLLNIGTIYVIKYIDDMFGTHYMVVQHKEFIHLQCDIDNFINSSKI